MSPNGPPMTFHRDTPLADILAALSTTKQQVYPILVDGRLLYGVIDFHDVRMFLTEHAVATHLLVAEDLRAADYRVLALDEDLASALRKFHAVQLPELPVVESEESPTVVGVLSRRDVIGAYHDKMYRITSTPQPVPVETNG
jgi:CIC family chloride channel protein